MSFDDDYVDTENNQHNVFYDDLSDRFLIQILLEYETILANVNLDDERMVLSEQLVDLILSELNRYALLELADHRCDEMIEYQNYKILNYLIHVILVLDKRMDDVVVGCGTPDLKCDEYVVDDRRHDDLLYEVVHDGDMDDVHF